MNKLFFSTLLVSALVLTACLGPKTTVQRVDDTQYAATEKVVFYFAKEIDPRLRGNSLLPENKRHKVIAKITALGSAPQPSGNSIYMQKGTPNWKELTVALEEQAKQLGANAIVITKIQNMAVRTLDSVSWSATSKQEHYRTEYKPYMEGNAIRFE